MLKTNYCEPWQYVIVIPNFVSFALSLTVSEISANFSFLKFYKKNEIYEMFQNVPNFNQFALSPSVSELSPISNLFLNKKLIF